LCSMSIPQVFPAYANQYEDGGLVNNLAVNLLPKTGKRIAFRVTETSRVGPVRGLIQRIEREASMSLSASENAMVMLANSLGIPVINLSGGNLGFLNTAMTTAQKKSLYQRGYEVTQQWLESPAGKEWLA
jgi:predicted acylesterase/phospholipase RssA